jgi:tRNA threonylcarbamoyladenosine biosynthesis protein TsaE
VTAPDGMTASDGMTGSGHATAPGPDRNGGTVTLTLPEVEDTRTLGRRLAGLLRPGDLVLLSGPLGAGKTVLAQGIGAGLGVDGPVTSPTFVIARVHRGGRVPMVHVDAYRLGTVADPRAEADDLDLDASVEESVTVVEWGTGVLEQLGDARLEVRIDRRPDESRVVELVPVGGDWPGRLGALPASDPATRTPAG